MTTLLLFFILLCVVGLIAWGINQIPGIPQIVKVVVYVIIGVFILMWLYNYVAGGGVNLSFGRH
jgi:hypothetical protein